MKPKLNPANLKGTWATLLLPVNADESFDYGALEAEIDMLIAAGVDGIYSNGTAGEFHNQTEHEFDVINGILAERCHAAGMRFQIGASHPSPVISYDRLKRSVEMKPDAIQVILPDWVTLTDAEMLTFLTKMCHAADGIPLVLYNPPHAKRVLKPVDYGLLKQLPQIIGVKLLNGDSAWTKEMLTHANHLSVFVPGHFLASGVASGVGSGAYSNVACINPSAAQNWWQLMQTDLPSALEIEKNILTFFGECIAPLQKQGYSNPALDKFLAAVGGHYQIGTRLRWPYRWIDESLVPAARERAKELIPYFFKPDNEI